ncbi:MAG: universal stress protein [Euryarchaeota archaeon]|nr:universal stress protein [Euryarchaeota archaeon]
MGIKLVAFDGSEASRKALSQAEGLLRGDDELLVLMVVPVAVIAEFADVPPDISTSRAQGLVNAAVTDLRERGVKALGLVREGDIADEILKLAADMPVDIIVIGHRGLSKIGRFALGSVADKVARYATRPVLIVR